ncbi:unnamed protein product [Trichobilharzia regenti]|nr:unnamed protein product [Trichobilharzia regenti]
MVKLSSIMPDISMLKIPYFMVKEHVKIPVIGACGLGCELLKDLAMMVFCHLEVIDMDMIDISNLNRKFLFRPHDVGKPKANVAAEFIMRRVPTCIVIPHYEKIQDFDESFYQQFNAVLCSLDSIIARRWINSLLASLVIQRTCFPCSLWLNWMSRSLPTSKHCIEYVRILLWPKEIPFGDGVAIDDDSPEHIQRIYEKSCERAKHYGISGVTLRLVQGVVKRIIPAVASTNPIIGSQTVGVTNFLE